MQPLAPYSDLMQITIIGGGLAGSEAAWQAAKLGARVRLYEMRPKRTTKAHRTDGLAELVCSNSFRGAALTNAVGLLKQELRVLDSLIMQAADFAAVPSGGALAVDRERFSQFVTTQIRSNPLIEVITQELTELPAFSTDNPLIVATGPLTTTTLAEKIAAVIGSEQLAFFDAISPIVTSGSLNYEKLFRASRYDKGGDDYLNAPFDREQYYQFVEAVSAGEKFGGHEEVESDQVSNLRPFEGCMPIEEMVERGKDTLRFGPLKPVGLRDPRDGKRPYAVVQLRQDNKEATLWSLVGFQTRLKHPEQLRIFRTIPGLEEAEFVRLGSVHRNTFVDSPRCLTNRLELRQHPGMFLAGQITGVEGYVESTACGLLAGVNAVRLACAQDPIVAPVTTAIGALIAYISDPTRTQFQPMNISFGLMPTYLAAVANGAGKKGGKDNLRLELSRQALIDVAAISAMFNSKREGVETQALDAVNQA